MLAHPLVKFSTFPPSLGDARQRDACNRWLQCVRMRIELPPASWADTAHRADDDAHTLTLVAQAPEEWHPPHAVVDGSPTLHTAVGNAPAVTVTLTLPL